MRFVWILMLMWVPSVYGATMTVDAARLEVDRKRGEAVFSGNVVVVRPDFKLTCDTLTGDFASKKLTEMVAVGNVVMVKTGGDGETVKGDRAVYNPSTGVVVVTGAVVLTQGGTTLTGSRLEYDVQAGKARLTGNGSVQATMDEGGQ